MHLIKADDVGKTMVQLKDILYYCQMREESNSLEILVICHFLPNHYISEQQSHAGRPQQPPFSSFQFTNPDCFRDITTLKTIPVRS